MPIQSGTNDSGLYAVAYVTAISMGEKPEFFFFEQRNNYTSTSNSLPGRWSNLKCSPITRRRRVKKRSVKAVEEIPIYIKLKLAIQTACNTYNLQKKRNIISEFVENG